MDAVPDSFIDYDSVADLYDLYATADHDVPFFASEVTGIGGPVLELTSGTGRLSVPLMKTGAHLTCVDVSAGMLRVLRRKVVAAGLRANIVRADMCHLPFGPSFLLAFVPFQAFMEILGESRQRHALSAVHASLRPGGRFICTLHNPAVRRRLADGATRLVGRFPVEGGTLVVSGVERLDDAVVTRLQYFEFLDRHGLSSATRVLPMQFELIEPERFQSCASDAGFRVLEVYGDYDRSPFDADRSPVMIWMLGKQPP